MGRQIFFTLVAAGAALAGGAVCVPVEWTDRNTVASSSLTSSVSYVYSGNGHRYLGTVVLCVPGRSFVFFVVLVVGVFPALRSAVSIEEKNGGAKMLVLWRNRTLLIDCFASG